jgi:hypothetical protein
VPLRKLYIVLVFAVIANLFGVNAETIHKSVSFNGTGYLSPGYFTLESNTVTVEFWAFRETWQVSVPEVLLSNYENGGWQFSVSNTSVLLKAFLDGIEKTISFPVSGLTDGWHHFAFTFDGSYLRFYLDGYQRGFVFDFKSQLSKPDAGTWLTVGCEAMVGGISGLYFTGQIDEVRIWNKMLSSYDIRDWMYREITELIKPVYLSNLALYYTFNDSAIYEDKSQGLNSTTGYDLVSYENSASVVSTVPVIDADMELLNTRALWSVFSQGTYSEPSGGLNLGITDYNEYDIWESDIFGHNGQTGVLSEETNDGVDLQAKRIWKIITNHEDEHPSLRFQIFEAGADALFYDCIPVYNYKLMYKAFDEDTFRIVDEADNMEGNLVFFMDVDIESGYYTIARDNDMPTVTSLTEVSDITTTTAVFGGAVGCDGGAEVTAYGVCWNTSGNATLQDFYSVDGSGTGGFTSLLDSLESGVVYYVRSYATNSEGTSYGEEMAFQTNKMYQSVIFPAIPEKSYGTTDFNPGAFATSGLPVTYSSSNGNVATITDEGKIHITGIGTSKIWAYQPGNTNYSPSSYKLVILTVKKAVLTVSAEHKTIVYGDTLPALTYSLSGFATYEDTSVLSLMPEITSNADNSSDAGLYSISVSGGVADNYTFEYLNGSLKINKANLVISAADIQLEYGETLPELKYVISGFVKGEDTSVLSVLPDITCTDADSIPDAGYYIIKVSGGESENYNLLYENGSLKVNKAMLTVVADNKSIVYGDSIPDLSYTISGYIRKDSAMEPNILPGLSTNAGPFSDAGSYSIFIAGAETLNYDFRFINGILTIEKAGLLVVAQDATMAFGSDLPEFSYQVYGRIPADPHPVFLQKPQISTDADKFSSVGEYEAYIAGGVSINYNLQYQNGMLTVIKALPELTKLPVATPLTEGESLENAEIFGGTTSTNGRYEFSDQEYVPDSTGEEVDVIFIPDDTVNYMVINLKVGVILTTSTSVILPKNNQLSVVPNPVKTSFSLQGVESGSLVKIFDTSGCLMQSLLWSEHSIDVSDFNPGIYIVITGNQMIKFVRQ